MAGQDERALAILRVDWHDHRSTGQERLSELLLVAGRRVLQRYLTESYGFAGCEPEDAAQEFAVFWFEHRSHRRTSDLLRRCTTIGDLERRLRLEAKRFAQDRFKVNLAGKLRKRIDALPSSLNAFCWVVPKQWIALTGGSRLPREGDQRLLAGTIAHEPSARDLVSEVERGLSPRLASFRGTVTSLLLAHQAAARVFLLVDAILILTGMHDTRPLRLRLDHPMPPFLDRHDLHDQAAEVHAELERWCTQAGNDVARLHRRYVERLAGESDPHLDRALRDAMEKSKVEPGDRALVGSLLADLLEPVGEAEAAT